MAPDAPRYDEVATTLDGRDITRGYIGALERLRPTDSVLQLRGAGDYAIYREVLRDDQVASTFHQRRLAVISREWEVQPGGDRPVDDEAADFLREQLEHIDFDDVTGQMLYGVFYGYAAAECLWKRDGARVALDAIKVRDRRRFAFDGAGRLRLLTYANADPGEELPPRKFWHFATGADHDDEPYGLGLAHWLYWPVFFKRNGTRLWLVFLDKFGQPTAVGKYPPSASKEEKDKLLNALQAVHSDSGIRIPEGMMIELLEAARSGTADYVALYDRMDKAIAKVTLGQTLTTEAAGGQYKAEVQMDVRQDLVKADADLVCQSFNASVARWLTEWNFPEAMPPKVWRKLDEPEDLSKLAERARTLNDIGFRPTLRQVEDDFGGEWVDLGPQGQAPALPPTPATGAAAFAEGDGPGGRDTADDQADRLEEEAALVLEGLVEPVRRLVEHADSLEAVRDGLFALYPEMEPAAFAEVMHRAFVAAELSGRLEADDA